MSNEYLVACELDPRDHSVIVAANVKHDETADKIGRWKSPLQILRAAPICCLYDLVPGAQPLFSICVLLPEDSQLPLADYPHLAPRCSHIANETVKLSRFPEA